MQNPLKHQQPNRSISAISISTTLAAVVAVGGFPEKSGASQSAAAETAVVRIRAVGDMMLGNTPNRQVPNFNYMRSVISETRKADVMFGNYEGTLCERELVSHKCRSEKGLCFAFRGPTRLARDLRQAGFHILNLANNHIFDYGHDCATETKSAIENEGMIAVGLKSSQKSSDSDVISTVEARGKKLGFVGIHYSNAWGRVISLNNTATVRKLVETAKKSHDLVVVSVHAGAEGPQFTRVPHGTEMYSGENRGDMRAFSKMAIDAGADLVIGHGPHVLRGMEVYKNKLIIHSLGNFATYTLFAFDHPMQLGAIVEVGLSDKGDFVDGLIIPTYQYYEMSASGGRGQIRLEFDPKARAISEFKRLSELDFSVYPNIDKNGRMSPPTIEPSMEQRLK